MYAVQASLVFETPLSENILFNSIITAFLLMQFFMYIHFYCPLSTKLNFSCIPAFEVSRSILY